MERIPTTIIRLGVASCPECGSQIKTAIVKGVDMSEFAGSFVPVIAGVLVAVCTEDEHRPHKYDVEEWDETIGKINAWVVAD